MLVVERSATGSEVWRLESLDPNEECIRPCLHILFTPNARLHTTRWKVEHNDRNLIFTTWCAFGFLSCKNPVRYTVCTYGFIYNIQPPDVVWHNEQTRSSFTILAIIMATGDQSLLDTDDEAIYKQLLLQVSCSWIYVSLERHRWLLTLSICNLSLENPPFRDMNILMARSSCDVHEQSEKAYF